MLGINTNLIHNILNFVGLIIGGLIAYDWTQLGLSAEQAAFVAGVVLLGDKIIKIGMNILRDGFSGLYKVQLAVRDDATISSPGTNNAGPNK